MASRTTTLRPKRKEKCCAGLSPNGHPGPQKYHQGNGHRPSSDPETNSDLRFRQLFDHAYEGMFQTTPDGRYLRVNHALAQMYGYENARELMSAVSDIGACVYVDPKRREEFKRLMEQNGCVDNFEYQVRDRYGRKIWLSEKAWAIRDDHGQIISYDGAVEDITERKRSGLERRVTTEILRAMTENENVDDLLGFIHKALKGVIAAENCFIALLNPGTGMFEFPFYVDQFDMRPEPTPARRSCMDYIFRTGCPALISEKTFAHLVNVGEVELVGTPSRSWLGVPLKTPSATIGVLVVQDYVTANAYNERDLEFLDSIGGQIALAIERKRAEERLHSSDARLRVLIEQLPAVLWTVDKDMRFTSAVGAGLARLGLKPNELVGVKLAEYLETSDGTYPAVAAHRRAVAGEPVTFHLEWKGGSYACHAEPLRGSHGEIQGVICMALDVTDRKQLEEQFRQAQKMEAVGRLAGGIAHDFNNLLMVIQGYGDLLIERLHQSDPLRKNVEQIQTASQRATSLTRQLLAFSRKQMLAPKVLNIQTVVADMENILRRLIGEDIVLEAVSAPSLGHVKADRSQIEQVVMNLAINARDAMPNGGRLTIEASNVEIGTDVPHAPTVVAPGRYVMLAVTDNGCGMNEEIRAHIFEPFFTTKEKGKGTGLGLATVYGIVKQSGGYVWVYSEPGLGTTFKIYLPRIAEEEAMASASGDSDAMASPRGSEVVLLVEDEKGVRDLTREYLQLSGYTVLDAQDGESALEIARTHAGPIHALITDVVMPGLSGRELGERMSDIRPGIKVLYMSGYTDQSAFRNGILDKGAELLQKPFGMSTLASKLREVLSAQLASQLRH
ncbi:MAG TPA: PAS domain S-box protein [Candidatus Acidoferrum sp.]|nr:PAS domain S-box protein [Candidatus Acidoferrum sp.]